MSTRVDENLVAVMDATWKFILANPQRDNRVLLKGLVESGSMRGKRD